MTETVNGSHSFLIQGYSIDKGIGVGKHIASERGIPVGDLLLPRRENLFKSTLQDQSESGKGEREKECSPESGRYRGSCGKQVPPAWFGLL